MEQRQQVLEQVRPLLLQRLHHAQEPRVRRRSPLRPEPGRYLPNRASDETSLGVDVYAYDANKNPISKQTLDGLNLWAYDPADQLIVEQHETGLVSTWSYDSIGNRIQQDRSQGGVQTVTLYDHDAANQRVQVTEGTAVTTVTFDANGNVTGQESVSGRITYTWNPRDLLTAYAQADGQVATFTHRFDGLRATIDPGDGSGATQLVWDPLGSSMFKDLLAETAADETVARQYWRGARLVTYKEGTQKGVYQFDHEGNTERLTDPLQAVLASYQNSAWGEVLTSAGSLGGQPFQYGGDWGAFRDGLSGDLWMRARVMHPAWGQFLSADAYGIGSLDIAHGLSLYGYVQNRPVLHIDPSGNIGGLLCIGACAISAAPFVGAYLGCLAGGLNVCDAAKCMWDFIEDLFGTEAVWNDVALVGELYVASMCFLCLALYLGEELAAAPLLVSTLRAVFNSPAGICVALALISAVRQVFQDCLCGEPLTRIIHEPEQASRISGIPATRNAPFAAP